MQTLSPSIPMSRETILQRAHGAWLDVVREFGADYIWAHGVDFDEVYEAVLYPQYRVIVDKSQDLGEDDSGDTILGMFLPKNNVALISRPMFENNDRRRVFTQWHEVAGHGILHGDWLRKHSREHPRLFDTQKSFELIENTFEWQANTFAANVAAPRSFVQAIWAELFGTRRKIRFCGSGEYSLIVNDNLWYVHARSPLNLAAQIARRIRHYFGGLSIESLAYQVLELIVDSNGYSHGELWRSDEIGSTSAHGLR